jgi:TldD protein
MTTVLRAPFAKDLQALRDLLPTLLPILGKDSQWYPSIWFERKSGQSFSASLKDTRVNESYSAGVVLRIYDGRTLHEMACDDLNPSSLVKLAEDFSNRVLANSSLAAGPLRPYRAPGWPERLQGVREPEILEQLPPQLDPATQVHFGIRYQEDPTLLSAAEATERLKRMLQKIQLQASQVGLTESELSYASARCSLRIEESVFVDAHVNLSQTLYRASLALVAMSGSNRTIHQEGGLGGTEAIEVSDEAIGILLADLKALQNAERIQPGKYRLLCSPELAGVIAHEAFGHAQEGDTCARGRSKAWELHHTGERVGNQHATILNNPAIFRNAGRSSAAWGSYFFDEEGWLAAEQVLLREGVLQAPMTNLTSAIRLGVPRTANGKRESWANGVYTRQTNTYFSAGGETFAQLMEKLGSGFVAFQAAGGMEDPKGMGIQVGIAWLREVRDGRYTGRVFRGPAGGDIQLTGYVPEVLAAIEAKSKVEFESEAPDQARHPWNDTGGCGKYHKEFVNAGCGGPWMLFDQVVLG